MLSVQIGLSLRFRKKGFRRAAQKTAAGTDSNCAPATCVDTAAVKKDKRQIMIILLTRRFYSYLEICHPPRFLKLFDPTSRSWKIYRVEILADGRMEEEEDNWFSKGLISLNMAAAGWLYLPGLDVSIVSLHFKAPRRTNPDIHRGKSPNQALEQMQMCGHGAAGLGCVMARGTRRTEWPAGPC
jgi:hypothetical protein